METFFLILAVLLVAICVFNKRKHTKLIQDVKEEFPQESKHMLKLRDNIFDAYEKGQKDYLVVDKQEREALVNYKLHHPVHYKKLEETLGLKIDDGLDLKKVF
tara:strand:+ start:5484 stop:5792 length:309 start_codon:yes stop_codon:yes gene_type:complete